MDREWKLMVNGLTLSMDDPQTRLTVQVNINFHFTFKVFDMTRLTYQETCGKNIKTYQSNELKLFKCMKCKIKTITCFTSKFSEQRRRNNNLNSANRHCKDCELRMSPLPPDSAQMEN